MDDDMQQGFLQLYAHEFPERERLCISSSISIGDGWESDLFKLRVEYEEAAEHHAEDVVLKIYYGRGSSQKAQNEEQGMKQLAQAGYPVPHVLLSAMEDSLFKRACIAMEYIQGQTLGKLFSDITAKEQRHALLTLFCQLFVELHKLDWQALIPDAASYQTQGFVSSWLAERRPEAEQLLPGVFTRIFDWLEARSSQISSPHLSITHGDYHPYNILMAHDEEPFVIDWTNIDISDYRFDLAWTLLLISTEIDMELRTIVLEEYERLAGHPVEHLDFFEVVACLRRLLDITLALSQSAASRGMRPEAEAQMRQSAPRIRAIYAQLQAHTGNTIPEIEQLISTLSQ